MELLNFIAERRERQGCFSHLGDGLLSQRHIIPLQEQSRYVSSCDDIKLYRLFLRGEELTLTATRCTTCCGSLSRITLQEAAKRHDQ